MRLAEQWREIERELPAGWASARLAVEVRDDRERTRAAALLGPANPGRAGHRLRLEVAHRGGAASPEAIRRLLGRLDDERIAGSLELVASEAAGETAATPRRALAEEWDAELARLPEDWSDLHCELRLRSSDDVDRAALALAPLNPSRPPGASALRFRAARVAGYGASPALARSRLAELDGDDVRGDVRVLRALSATDHVQTLGPVWYLEGQVV